MIVIPRPLDWPVLEWVPAERNNFGVLRDHSDESEVLADAVCRELARWWLPAPLSTMRLLDYGAEPASALAASLRSRVGSYTPVQLGGEAEAADYLSGLTAAGRRPTFDAVLMCHVLPYISRPDLVLSVLAQYAEPTAVIVAVGLAPHGDQHDIAVRARERDARYPRRYDHAVHLQRWLAGHGIPRTAQTIWSRASANNDDTLRRLVEFMLGSVDPDLVDAVTGTVPRGAGGGAVLRTAHALIAWPLRYHQVDQSVDPAAVLSPAGRAGPSAESSS